MKANGKIIFTFLNNIFKVNLRNNLKYAFKLILCILCLDYFQFY